mmetsp:Transcript_4856/g.10294  ORF Transcript_4856/g.10294 Transcript_4856/m.10294 type:complete len:864 (-) Transcript_4856:124-2715(-)
MERVQAVPVETLFVILTSLRVTSAINIGRRIPPFDDPYQNEPSCAQLQFNWTEDDPFDFVKQKQAISPLKFHRSCPETQRCLFLRDDALHNAMLSAYGLSFPTFQNVLLNDPSVEEQLTNAYIVYDEHSEMYIDGIGLYKGPSSIGEYRIVPTFVGKSGQLQTKAVQALPAQFTIGVDYETREQWDHLQGTKEATVNVTWRADWRFYPCSVMRQAESTSFPPFTGKAFTGAAQVNGAVEKVCQVIMSSCNGSNAQFSSFTECVTYQKALPFFDSTCQALYGPNTAQGQSWMCKYLHSFMIWRSPELHCFHAGRGMPDANGAQKCTPSDCASTTPRLPSSSAYQGPTCSARDTEELAEATLYALEYCLPSLAAGTGTTPGVCSANCTQAVNTFLGRHVVAGTVCACQAAAPNHGVSKLLDLLMVDAATLVRSCSGSPSLAFEYPACLQYSLLERVPCEEPDQYTARGGCRGWNFEVLEAGFVDEWRASRQKHGRVTRSNAVATAECFLFTDIMTLHLNINHNDIIARAAALTGGDVYVHPDGGRAVITHAGVVEALQLPQKRGAYSQRFSHCSFGTFGALHDSTMPMVPLLMDTDSPEHTAARALAYELLPGLSDTNAATVSHITEDERDEDDVGLIRKMLSVEVASELLGVHIPNEERVKDLNQLASFWFGNERFHRAHGYLLATGLLKEMLTLADELELILNQTHLQAAVDGSQLRDVNPNRGVVDLIGPLSALLPSFTANLVLFVRGNPCDLLPLWEESPHRFVVEFSRYLAPASGFRARVNGAAVHELFHIYSANHDPTVFPNPRHFDPTRQNLGEVLTWNVLEADAGGGGRRTGRRACPARAFSVRFAVANAPRFFPAT